MKTLIKKGFTGLGLSILMMIFWIIGLYMGNIMFPSTLMEMEPDTNTSGELMLLIVCILNTSIILYFIYHSKFKGWPLVGIVFLVAFGIQYFMSQIETIWFNDSINIPTNGIWAIISGGIISYLLFSPMAVLVAGKFKKSSKSKNEHFKFDFMPIAIKTVLLSVFVWPLIYFLAGYYIAWQFPEVRSFYTDTSEIESFFSIMKENVMSGLYFFSILRGIFWILIAWLILYTIKGSKIHKGLILGLLFAILGSSGLLIPNPVMPFMVRMAHLIETTPSSFLWGFIIALIYNEFNTLNFQQKVV